LLRLIRGQGKNVSAGEDTKYKIQNVRCKIKAAIFNRALNVRLRAKNNFISRRKARIDFDLHAPFRDSYFFVIT
jgi:hypothetical protein